MKHNHFGTIVWFSFEGVLRNNFGDTNHPQNVGLLSISMNRLLTSLFDLDAGYGISLVQIHSQKKIYCTPWVHFISIPETRIS